MVFSVVNSTLKYSAASSPQQSAVLMLILFICHNMYCSYLITYVDHIGLDITLLICIREVIGSNVLRNVTVRLEIYSGSHLSPPKCQAVSYKT
jgi:hypothetical protein